MLYLESIRNGLQRAFADSHDVVLLGEDVSDPYGGAFKVTKGLSSAFPDRVFQTPISESAIVGLCTGLALRGKRPVGEIMFGDFLTLCSDQIINSATKFPLMYGDDITVPWVLRTPMAGIRGYGPTHSQSLEKFFFGVPGLNAIAPSRLHDPGEILYHAVLKDDLPTLFIEDKGDYPKALFDYKTGRLQKINADSDPLATCSVCNYEVKEHTADIQIVAYGGAASMAGDVLSALAEEEIYSLLHAVARVNDHEELTRLVSSLDTKIPLLIIEQGTGAFGWGAEIVALMMQGRDRVSCPLVRRLSAQSQVIPATPEHERKVVVTPEKIESTILEMII
ncbi:alpha-ketoacid dehydrogenase subunit beta [Marinifilum sp. JC120]|nr:alpha-ketoacid dehydrogenase subunit beta [Marinifilum sp. JC120]